MKKIILLLFILFLVIGCRKVDSIIFKEEFESLNDKYTKVSIKSDNPVNYITEEDLIKKLENKEDIIVLFGYSKSNETRNILENLFDVLNELKIDKIYYLDIGNIRDEKQVINDEIKIIKEGSNYYNKLLNLLDNNLKEYIINNKSVGKRIYAPTILMIKNKNIDIIDGLNDNITKETIKEFFNNYNSCNPNEGC